MSPCNQGHHLLRQLLLVWSGAHYTAERCYKSQDFITNHPFSFRRVFIQFALVYMSVIGYTQSGIHSGCYVRTLACWIGIFKLQQKKKKRILRWLNTVLAVCEYMSFARSWQEKGSSSKAETWQVKNILMKDFDWQVKFDVFVVSMATWTIEYNLKISLLLSLHKIRSLDFPINLPTAYYN